MNDRAFTGSVPALYEQLLVPLIFKPYAEDLARRMAARRTASLLELAAGTGVVTRALASALPASTAIIATDLNPAMLEEAAKHPIARPVKWQKADACAIPFPDALFDAVVCQFGVMFFPDRIQGFREARRVLKPGGVFAFNTWDAIADNEFADEITKAHAHLFPAKPPRFLARTPHGYHDRARILADLSAAGFVDASIEVVSARSRAPGPKLPAIAYCQGTPLRGELEALGAGALAKGTEGAVAAIAKRFGTGPVDGKIQALVVTATK